MSMNSSQMDGSDRSSIDSKKDRNATQRTSTEWLIRGRSPMANRRHRNTFKRRRRKSSNLWMIIWGPFGQRWTSPRFLSVETINVPKWKDPFIGFLASLAFACVAAVAARADDSNEKITTKQRYGHRRRRNISACRRPASFFFGPRTR